MCVCIYICVYMYTYICNMYMYIHVIFVLCARKTNKQICLHMHKTIRAHTRQHTRIKTHANTHTPTCTHAYVRVRIVYTCEAHVCTRVHAAGHCHNIHGTYTEYIMTCTYAAGHHHYVYGIAAHDPSSPRLHGRGCR